MWIVTFTVSRRRYQLETEKPDQRFFSRPRIFLFGLAALLLAVDIRWVLSDDFDLNQHIPFLYPLVFIALGLITLVIDRATPPERLNMARDLAHRGSAFHQDNLPTDRAREGRFD